MPVVDDKGMGRSEGVGRSEGMGRSEGWEGGREDLNLGGRER